MLRIIGKIGAKTGQGLAFIQNNKDVRFYVVLSIDDSLRKSDQAIMINIMKIILFRNWLGETKNENELGEGLKELICNAENGDVHSQVELGKIYCRSRHFEKAVTFLVKSAERGNKDARFVLGLCYEFGLGVEKDRVEAREWYERSRT